MDAKVLLKFSLFQGLTEDRINSFLSEAVVTSKRYQAGNLIFLQGGPCVSLFLLNEGALRAMMNNNEGKQVIIETMQAPRVIAPAALFATENYFPINIIAYTDCTIIAINKNSFYDLMHREPWVMENYVKILSDKSIFLTHKINGFALQNLKGRLASYLLMQKTVETQQDVADFLGVARPSLSRVLSEFVVEGAVKMEGRSITVVNAIALKKYI
jgi:Cyclic nucleotide-binding domain.